jgi:hypothetical protein
MEAPLPYEVIKTMASREDRLHHWLWHQVRNSWFRYPPDVQKRVDELGWKPPRPVFDANGEPDLKNNAGEDFLYMHRQMINDVNTILQSVADPAYPRIQPWIIPPPPGDEDFPVPRPWFDPTGQGLPLDRLDRVKSDIFYDKRMIQWQNTFTDPTFLRGVSLGEIGVMIELTIHNAMHMRWSASPSGSRPDPGPTEGDTISTQWDDPRYDFLGDTYSSHVNPIFWKLHGWIDDRVEDWKAANAVFGIDQFWQGKWLGKMPGHEEGNLASARSEAVRGQSGHVHGHEDDTHHHGDEMEELVHVIARSGVIHAGIANPVSYEIW